MKKRDIILQFPQLVGREELYKEVRRRLYRLKDFSENPKSISSVSSIRRHIRKALEKDRRKERNKCWMSQKLILEYWLKSTHGFSLKWKSTSKGEIISSEKTIVLNSKHSEERQLYILLHECGHLLLENSKNYLRDFPFEKTNRLDNFFEYDQTDLEMSTDLQKIRFLNKIVDNWGLEGLVSIDRDALCAAKKIRREDLLIQTKEHCLLIIKEEIAAWSRGRQLARRLDLFVDDEKFMKIQTECVYTYVDWAATVREIF